MTNPCRHLVRDLETLKCKGCGQEWSPGRLGDVAPGQGTSCGLGSSPLEALPSSLPPRDVLAWDMFKLLIRKSPGMQMPIYNQIASEACFELVDLFLKERNKHDQPK